MGVQRSANHRMIPFRAASKVAETVVATAAIPIVTATITRGDARSARLLPSIRHASATTREHGHVVEKLCAAATKQAHSVKIQTRVFRAASKVAETVVATAAIPIVTATITRGDAQSARLLPNIRHASAITREHG